MENNLGVALTKSACKLCGKVEDDTIILNKVLTKHMAKKVEEMHGKVLDFMPEPCDECKSYMEQGILLISIDEEKTVASHQEEVTSLEHSIADAERKTWSSVRTNQIKEMKDLLAHIRNNLTYNPWRTGGIFVVTEDFVTRAFPEKLVDAVIKKRASFISHEVATGMGLFAAAAKK